MSLKGFVVGPLWTDAYSLGWCKSPAPFPAPPAPQEWHLNYTTLAQYRHEDSVMTSFVGTSVSPICIYIGSSICRIYKLRKFSPFHDTWRFLFLSLHEHKIGRRQMLLAFKMWCYGTLSKRRNQKIWVQFWLLLIKLWLEHVPLIFLNLLPYLSNEYDSAFLITGISLGSALIGYGSVQMWNNCYCFC